MGNREKLAIDLRRLGVAAGDVLLVHTSMKGLNTLGLRAEEVIECLLEALGEGGTLLVPALSYRDVTPENPVFDVRETPSCIGALPECFRKQYAQYRSLHPTHSVCARGKLAYALTAWHQQDQTPVGEHSPFRQLPLLGGKILMLGCGLKPNTFMHGVEEAARASYPLAKEQVTYRLTNKEGETFEKAYYPHSFGKLKQRYDRLLYLLSFPDLAKGDVLNGDAWLLDAEAVMKTAAAKIREEEYYFVD